MYQTSTVSGIRKYSTNIPIKKVKNTLMPEKYAQLVDLKETIIALFLDHEKSFETIDRNKLVEKLSVIGIRNNELVCFKSYKTKNSHKI